MLETMIIIYIAIEEKKEEFERLRNGKNFDNNDNLNKISLKKS